MSKNYFAIFDTETTGIEESDIPIELGMLFIDEDFDLIDAISTLVKLPELEEFKHIPKIENNELRGLWNLHAVRAMEVHGITYDDVEKNGVSATVAVKMIRESINRFAKQDDRIILVSDNGWFDTHHLKKIYEAAFGKAVQFPFHYTTYDTNLLFGAHGVKDPKPVHRALPDAMLLYNALLKALPQRKILVP